MEQQRWPRGSEWRKWDLHIHAPKTKLNDQFKTSDGSDVWKSYCQKLHDSDVQVFGIADYFSIDSYLSVCEKYKARYPDSPKVFFPNIELRLSYVVNKQQAEVNTHLIFNSSWPNHIDKIKYFISQLKTNKTDNSDRHTKASELSNDDCNAATTTREFIREALAETYGKNAELLDYVLIITAANNDGIRAESGNQRKCLIADELDKFSDAFFGNANNVDYFLSSNRAENKKEYTKPKPVLSCCDAHSLDDLDRKLGQVFFAEKQGTVQPTWIKADPTFEGLKQIIFEPRSRVYIGEKPEIERRVRQHKTRYIESLHISCVDGYQQQHGDWFHDENIVFGKELVAIIGNKGGGKSAVTDIIGLLGNSRNQTWKEPSSLKTEELFSFLNKNKFLKGGIAKHFKGTLNWHEGKPDIKQLDEQVSDHLEERVEYLPQKYLERICANVAYDEFRATLESVIFRYVKKQDQHGKASLNDLIQYLSQQAEQDIALKKTELQQANLDVVFFEKKLTEDYRKELKDKIERKQEELNAHAKVFPIEKPKPTAAPQAETTEIEGVTKNIEGLEAEIRKLEAEQGELKHAIEQLQQVRQSIKRAVEALLGLETEHKDVLESSGLNFDHIVTLNVNYPVLDSAIDKRVKRSLQIDDLLLAVEEAGSDEVKTANSLVCQKARLETDKAKIIERLGKSEREYQQYLSELKQWQEREKELRGEERNPGAETLNGLNNELNNISNLYLKQMDDARSKRKQTAKEVFSKKRGLTEFYNKVKQAIDQEVANCREFLGEYNISIDAGLHFSNSFYEEVFKYIDQGKKGSFYGANDGKVLLRNLCGEVNDWENGEQIFKALENIVNALHVDMRDDVSSQKINRNVFKQMKGQKTPQELYDYLFGFDYLEPRYDLKVDGKNLSELSPGERGGLLLIFYLMLDKQDIPLVIDQPEDNLDNQSVYQILVKFIQQAKKRRQIILVTHNPNLAVAADAEQIIHVSIDKKNGRHEFDFFSGAIEEQRINQAVIDILEGTKPAFDNRRLKYRKHEDCKI
ncbi:TrlF family AAA-like ATPase [Candidatus Electronema sp. JC]|uniref:TrlF family AAA-like ATPase n=1 Tax=Candidatus Electronema sp. JC TaxID=3401570 RepID=UPI003B437B86